MKKLFALLLALALLSALALPTMAEDDAVVLTKQTLKVHGIETACEAYNIGGYNYFKLRDLALLMMGTESRFAVGYDSATQTVTVTTGIEYTPDDSELAQRGDYSAFAQKSAQKLFIDGKERGDLSVYNIGGYNFFKLRDLGTALGFGVDYDPETNSMLVTSQPTMASELKGGVMPVPMGRRVAADFNGDGRDETVRVWLEAPMDSWGFNVHLTIDGTALTDELLTLKPFFDAPDEFFWLVTDVDEADGVLEFALQDWGPSDDLTTHFFRYDGERLSYLGNVEGFFYFEGHDASASVLGGGRVRSELRLSVLQTWWAMTEYALGADGKFAPVPQDFYTSTATDQQTTLQCALYGWADRDGQPAVLPAGTTAQIVGTDNVRWVLLRLADGSDCWLKFTQDNGYKLEAPDGEAVCWDALSDLMMAD